jgi:hypothetical protein
MTTLSRVTIRKTGRIMSVGAALVAGLVPLFTNLGHQGEFENRV